MVNNLNFNQNVDDGYNILYGRNKCIQNKQWLIVHYITLNAN